MRIVLFGLVLAGAFAHFLAVGAPALDRLESSRAGLLEREAELRRRSAEFRIVGHDEFSALVAERDRVQRLVAQRRDRLLDAPPEESDLAGALERSLQPSLAPGTDLSLSLLATAQGHPRTEPALAAVVAGLSGLPGLRIESLADLAPEEASRPLAGLEQEPIRERQVQLVLLADVADATACLEALALQPGKGLPQCSLLSASVRRIEPDRWGTGLTAFRGPPVRLAATFGVLVPAETP